MICRAISSLNSTFFAVKSSSPKLQQSVDEVNKTIPSGDTRSTVVGKQHSVNAACDKEEPLPKALQEAIRLLCIEEDFAYTLKDYRGRQRIVSRPEVIAKVCSELLSLRGEVDAFCGNDSDIRDDVVGCRPLFFSLWPAMTSAVFKDDSDRVFSLLSVSLWLLRSRRNLQLLAERFPGYISILFKSLTLVMGEGEGTAVIAEFAVVLSQFEYNEQIWSAISMLDCSANIVAVLMLSVREVSNGQAFSSDDQARLLTVIWKNIERLVVVHPSCRAFLTVDFVNFCLDAALHEKNDKKTAHRVWSILGRLVWTGPTASVPTEESVTELTALSQEVRSLPEKHLVRWLNSIRGLMRHPKVSEAMGTMEFLFLYLRVCDGVIVTRDELALLEVVSTLDEVFETLNKKLVALNIGTVIVRLGDAFMESEGQKQAAAVEAFMVPWYRLFVFVVDSLEESKWRISLTFPDTLLRLALGRVKVFPPSVMDSLIKPLILYSGTPEGRVALREGTSLTDMILTMSEVSWEASEWAPVLSSGLQILAFALTEQPAPAHSLLLRTRVTPRVMSLILSEAVDTAVLSSAMVYLRSLTFHSSEMKNFIDTTNGIGQLLLKLQELLVKRRNSLELTAYVVGVLNNLAAVPSLRPKLLTPRVIHGLLMVETEHRQDASAVSKVWSTLSHLATGREDRKKLLKIEPAGELFTRVIRSIQEHEREITGKTVIIHALIFVRAICKSRRGIRALKGAELVDLVVDSLKQVQWESVRGVEQLLVMMEVVRQMAIFVQDLFPHLFSKGDWRRQHNLISFSDMQVRKSKREGEDIHGKKGC